MKKKLSLLLVLVMCLSMAACGGDSSEVDEIAVEESSESAQEQDTTEGTPTDEQMQALTDAYNQVATIYNDVATAVNENGWVNDEQTATDIQMIGDVLEPIGVALTEDLSALYGADFDTLPDVLLEFIPELEAMAEKVAEPYEEEGMTVVTDEKLVPLANALNEVVPIYNEVYVAAEANGWLADEQTAAELQAVVGTLTFTQSALTDDPSKLEEVTDIDALTDSILQLGDALSEVAERVSFPYESAPEK